MIGFQSWAAEEKVFKGTGGRGVWDQSTEKAASLGRPGLRGPMGSALSEPHIANSIMHHENSSDKPGSTALFHANGNGEMGSA